MEIDFSLWYDKEREMSHMNILSCASIKCPEAVIRRLSVKRRIYETTFKTRILVHT